MGTMERYSKVGMQELDQRLSKIVEAARKEACVGLSLRGAVGLDRVPG